MATGLPALWGQALVPSKDPPPDRRLPVTQMSPGILLMDVVHYMKTDPGMSRRLYSGLVTQCLVGDFDPNPWAPLASYSSADSRCKRQKWMKRDDTISPFSRQYMVWRDEEDEELETVADIKTRRWVILHKSQATIDTLIHQRINGFGYRQQRRIRQRTRLEFVPKRRLVIQSHISDAQEFISARFKDVDRRYRRKVREMLRKHGVHVDVAPHFYKYTNQRKNVEAPIRVLAEMFRHARESSLYKGVVK